MQISQVFVSKIHQNFYNCRLLTTEMKNSLLLLSQLALLEFNRYLVFVPIQL